MLSYRFSIQLAASASVDAIIFNFGTLLAEGRRILNIEIMLIRLGYFVRLMAPINE